MFLVVGLGNPGSKYAGNRHNVGFMLVDRLAERFRAGPFREKFAGELVRVASPDVVLLKPMTFMNASGESVHQAMSFFKLELSQVIVVHDELDVPFGQCRLKLGGGAAGHNGLKSIQQQCGGQGFIRLRVGIGRPPYAGEVVAHVLGDFSALERSSLESVLEDAALGVDTVLAKGVVKAMNAFNTRDKSARG